MSDGMNRESLKEIHKAIKGYDTGSAKPYAPVNKAVAGAAINEAVEFILNVCNVPRTDRDKVMCYDPLTQRQRVKNIIETLYNLSGALDRPLQQLNESADRARERVSKMSLPEKQRLEEAARARIEGRKPDSASPSAATPSGGGEWTVERWGKGFWDIFCGATKIAGDHFNDAAQAICDAHNATLQPRDKQDYETVVEAMQLLEQAGMGKPGKPNTLLAMVKEVLQPRDCGEDSKEQT